MVIDKAFLIAKPMRKALSIIWKVEAVDSFRADMNWLNPIFHLASEQYAHSYWKQAASPSPFWEYLLTPPVSVIEAVE